MPLCSLAPIFTDLFWKIQRYSSLSLQNIQTGIVKRKKFGFVCLYVCFCIDDGGTHETLQMSGAGVHSDVSTSSGQFLEKVQWKEPSNGILKSLPFYLSKERWLQKNKNCSNRRENMVAILWVSAPPCETDKLVALAFVSKDPIGLYNSFTSLPSHFYLHSSMVSVSQQSIWWKKDSPALAMIGNYCHFYMKGGICRGDCHCVKSSLVSMPFTIPHKVITASFFSFPLHVGINSLHDHMFRNVYLLFCFPQKIQYSLSLFLSLSHRERAIKMYFER